MNRYDNNLNLLVAGGMNINSGEVAATVGRKIRIIYTQGLLQNNLTASVKVKVIFLNIRLEQKNSGVIFGNSTTFWIYVFFIFNGIPPLFPPFRVLILNYPNV